MYIINYSKKFILKLIIYLINNNYNIFHKESNSNYINNCNKIQ